MLIEEGLGGLRNEGDLLGVQADLARNGGVGLTQDNEGTTCVIIEADEGIEFPVGEVSNAVDHDLRGGHRVVDAT